MTPLIPFVAGLAALVGAWLVLRSIGPRFRVGRLLATTPRISVEEALRLAEAGTPRYVRVDGRVDAEDEFEDADHRPLVFRRTRFQALRTGRWVTVDDGRELVPFTVREGLAAIAVDGAALDEGLAVIPRVSAGTAGEAGDRVPADLPPATPVRARIEQVSSVEHAIVLGVPVKADGTATMTAGLGRPLVLTTLEPAEAMRILAADHPGRPRLAAILVAAGVALLAVASVWWLIGFLVPPVVAAASPSPVAGDPRSSGEGPGLVGEPMFAIAVVALIALVSVVATLAYIRFTRGGGRP